MPEYLTAHYQLITKALAGGRVIPFFGAGVNLCGRPPDASWTRHPPEYLPSGSELADHLAQELFYPDEKGRDLLRVSQYIAVMQGLGPLYYTLHDLFDGDYPPTALHNFFAALPGNLEAKGYAPQSMLIVTTNYDDLMERAFKQAGVPFEMVSYIADGEHRGKFLHWSLDGEGQVIERPNEFRELSLDKHPVILKIHGDVDRQGGDKDSFVITEDHYIDYLTRTNISNLVPVTLAARLRTSHFLFLGYSLRDWNLRVILHRIWGEQKLSWRSWAIQLDPDPLEVEFWRKRGVDILRVRLEDYIEGLSRSLDEVPARGDAP